MKFLSVLILSLLSFIAAHSQDKGIITCKELKPRAGETNTFYYKPAPKVVMPADIQVAVIYPDKGRATVYYTPISKTGKIYTFNFKTPDSVPVVIFSIVERRKVMSDFRSLALVPNKILDNNRDEGFVFYFYDKQLNEFPNKKILLASLLQDDVIENYLGVKNIADDSFIKIHAEAYKVNPALMKEDTYVDYLAVLYKADSTSYKSQMVTYADNLFQNITNERDCYTAKRIYRILKMRTRQQELEEKQLRLYPIGELAREKFWEKFNSDKIKSQQSILDSMSSYIRTFGDSSVKLKDRFYNHMIFMDFENKDWNHLKQTQDKSSDFSVAVYYNYFAWKLSGKRPDNSGTNLDIAKIFSRKSLDYLDAVIRNSSPEVIYNSGFNGMRNAYCETYALVSYKLGEFETAFYYQDAVYKQGYDLGEDGLERYAAYMEKVKGPSYTKQFIETQLLKGINSGLLKQQLQTIYKALAIPEDALTKLKEQAYILAKQNKAEKIKAKYGTLKAKEFSLKNLQGKNISLSDLKGKVVFLDFWATWCGPCRAAFPDMQKLVDKYKNDSDVVFLFIDVWENKTWQQMQEAAVNILKENNYSFNVLLDVSSKSTVDYKVTGIPEKIIIDKKGNLVYTGNAVGVAVSEGDSIDKLSEIIEEAKK